MLDVKEVPGQNPDLIDKKDIALNVFDSFEKIIRPFMGLFPEGNFEWNKNGILGDFDFEGEFRRDVKSYIRFTEIAKKEGENNG